jgi:hypothetical protein
LLQYHLYESRHKAIQNCGLIAIRKKWNFSQLTYQKSLLQTKNHSNQEIEEDVTTLPQNILPVKILSPKEIKEEIGFLNIKMYLVSTKSLPK